MFGGFGTSGGFGSDQFGTSSGFGTSSVFGTGSGFGSKPAAGGFGAASGFPKGGPIFGGFSKGDSPKKAGGLFGAGTGLFGEKPSSESATKKDSEASEKPKGPKPWATMAKLQSLLQSLTTSTVDSVEQYILSVPSLLTEDGASKVIEALAFIGFDCGEEAACMELTKRLYARKEFEAVFLDSLLQVRHAHIMNVIARFTKHCYNMKLFDMKTLIEKVQSIYSGNPEKREIVYYIYLWFAPEFDVDRKLATNIGYGMKTSTIKHITKVAESLDELKENNWKLYKSIESGDCMDVMEQIIAEDDVESFAIIGTQQNFSLAYKASTDWRNEECTLIQLAIRHKATKCLQFMYSCDKEETVKVMKSDLTIAKSLEISKFAAKNTNCITAILYSACLYHRMDVFKWILFHKFDSLKFKDQAPTEYLLDACITSNNIVALNLLISLGLTYKNIAPPQSLYRIIRDNRMELFMMVLSMQELDLKNVDSEKGSAVEYAIRLGRQEFAQILLEPSRALVNASKLMHLLIDLGNHALLEQILTRKDVDTTAKDVDGRSILDKAVSQHDINAIVLLIKFGVSPNGLNLTEMINKTTKLHVMKAIESVLAIDNTIIASEKCFAVHSAAKRGYLDVLQLFAKMPTFNPNHRNNSKMTPLHTAASHGHKDIVLFMLEKGADINATNIFGASALHMAIEAENEDITMTLLAQKDIDVNVQTKVGFTPLHIAAASGNVVIVKALMAHPKINPKLTNSTGMLPIDLAETHGHAEITAILNK